MRRQFYTSFAGKAIPPANRKEDIGTHEAKSGIIETCGGYIDGYTGYAPVSAKEVSIRFDLYSCDPVTLDEKVEEWKSLVSKKDKLVRRVGNLVQWAYARLMSLSAETDYEKPASICNIELHFELISPSWYGHSLAAWSFNGAHSFDEGLYFDQGNDFTLSFQKNQPASFQLLNHGNMNVTDLTLTFKGNGSSYSIDEGLDINFSGAGEDGITKWSFTLTPETTIPESKWITINTGRKIAFYENNGQKISLYKSISIGDDHRSMCWAELLPGTNTITVSTQTQRYMQLKLSADFVDKWR
jgi:hypothetical protein